MIKSAQILGISTAHIKPLPKSEHYLHADIIDAFTSMQSDAASNDIDLQVCSSFRSFDKQLSIWNRKWQGQLPLYTLDGDQLDSDTLNDIEKIHAIMLWSALPGASRHHWGTDFDVYDKAEVLRQNHKFELVPSEYEDGGPCDALSKWIQKNAQKHGFSLPYANYVGGVAAEPWHLSYRPLAEKIQNEFAIEELAHQLAQSDVLGKQTVLSILPELVERYTFNHGIVLN